MKIKCALGLCFLFAAGRILAQTDFPIVPADIEAGLFAREPLTRNPCAIAFDARGRLCVGMGPQYRRPTPETSGDSVFILIDDDGDGAADRRKEFASGFNNIQGLAWRGGELWVANAPDLTVVRDLDGDDEADEYVRLYTDLGNLEHGLHGLNWGPDGKLYMSKGNSKGLTQPPDRIAPKPFRELWGVEVSQPVPDFPEPETFDKSHYQRNYHDPDDDWGLNGGILRCDPDGSRLEIISRGFRNPWDIAFDGQFEWLGTDNDQTLGDKIFSPFYGANFGWGHPWSYDWKGDGHLPSAPSSGPLFEGSGAGVMFCDHPDYPDAYRGVFLINDWLRRAVYIYRPRWDGAWMKPSKTPFELLAHAGGGRTMESSSGRRFDPVDIMMGPDGAIYISSWGRQYGAEIQEGSMVNEGRIYRLRPKSFSDSSARTTSARTSLEKHRRALEHWTVPELIEDLGSALPVWRVNAQEELIRRGTDATNALLRALDDEHGADESIETWALWTLGRIGIEEPSLDDAFAIQPEESFNQRLQSIRILAHRTRERGGVELPDRLRPFLSDSNARIRRAVLLAMHQVGETRWKEDLLSLAAEEKDRIVYYSAWQAMRTLLAVESRRALLRDPRDGVRCAALLSLLEDDVLSDTEIGRMVEDADPRIAALASRRLGGKSEAVIRGRALVQSEDAVVETVSAAGVISVAGAIKSESGRDYREAVLQPGALAYTDRPYRIRNVPAALIDETFIQGANDDADWPSGTSLKIDLRFPSIVYLADDERGERLPLWAANRFQPADMVLTTDDASLRVYKAEYPAGPAVFGANREGVTGRKAHYLLIIQPHMLSLPEEPAVVEQVLAGMERAESERGRSLFLSGYGANCAVCHRLEGRGNAFAPDLSDIGTRADAAFIARSILQPSAEITEGFAAQTLTMKNGEEFEGIILEETGRGISLATAAGERIEIQKAMIQQRESARTSAMPAIFGSALSSRDVADIVAYLLASSGESRPFQRKQANNPLVAPMKESTVSNDGQPERKESKELELRFQTDRLVVELGGQPIAVYHSRHPEVRRPFFANLKTPSGIQVTRNYPPIPGTDAVDHANMHPGLSMGFAILDGVNFWHNTEGEVAHEGFHDVAAHSDRAVFGVANRYEAPDGRVICRERTRYQFIPNDDGWLLTIDAGFSSPSPFYFGVKEEMGLNVRMASPLTVRDGNGLILNSAGGVNEKETWGKVDRWWDYGGTIQERRVGVQIMSGPGNPETWSHSRDYGALVANPFPIDIEANRGKRIWVRPGETFRLRFGVQVHEHSSSMEYDLSGAYRRYLSVANGGF